MKETLTREEILERSKRENRNGDERERTVRVQGESFSLIFVFLMGLALIAWKRFHSPVSYTHLTLPTTSFV